jgi:hypothetical protein
MPIFYFLKNRSPPNVPPYCFGIQILLAGNRLNKVVEQFSVNFCTLNCQLQVIKNRAEVTKFSNNSFEVHSVKKLRLNFLNLRKKNTLRWPISFFLTLCL